MVSTKKVPPSKEGSSSGPTEHTLQDTRSKALMTVPVHSANEQRREEHELTLVFKCCTTGRPEAEFALELLLVVNERAEDDDERLRCLRSRGGPTLVQAADC